MDFSIDLKRLCQGEGDELLTRSRWSLATMRPFQTGIWPMRLFIDLVSLLTRRQTNTASLLRVQLRIAGCDRDGGVILLGRTFMLDPQKSLERP